jgi:hypothetical protein
MFIGIVKTTCFLVLQKMLQTGMGLQHLAFYSMLKINAAHEIH